MKPSAIFPFRPRQNRPAAGCPALCWVVSLAASSTLMQRIAGQME